MNRASETCRTINKRSNIYVIGIPGEKFEIKKIFKIIMTENSLITYREQ